MADVLGDRAGGSEEAKIETQQQTASSTTTVEESKTDQPSLADIDPAELNDIAQGEFRIEALRMKNAEVGSVLWESSEWDLASDEE